MVDQVFFKTDTVTIQVLKAKGISSCKYSIDMLQFLLPFAEEKMVFRSSRCCAGNN